MGCQSGLPLLRGPGRAAGKGRVAGPPPPPSFVLPWGRPSGPQDAAEPPGVQDGAEPPPHPKARARAPHRTDPRAAAPQRIVVIGAGWGGLSVAHALSQEPGMQVTVVDAAPRAGGLVGDGYTTAGGRRAEAGQHGFWDEYRNIFRLLDSLDLPADPLSGYAEQGQYSPKGLEAVWPVYREAAQLPTGLGQALYTRFLNLSPLDLASAAPLVLAFSEFDDSPEVWARCPAVVKGRGGGAVRRRRRLAPASGGRFLPRPLPEVRQRVMGHFACSRSRPHVAFRAPRRPRSPWAPRRGLFPAGRSFALGARCITSGLPHLSQFFEPTPFTPNSTGGQPAPPIHAWRAPS